MAAEEDSLMARGGLIAGNPGPYNGRELSLVWPSVDPDAVDVHARAAKECDDFLGVVCVRRKLVALYGAATRAAEAYARS